ncbi:chemotaxis protein CheW [Aggregatilinea lenta]|uniref:chemotaxis protein CheW n=1 Tax=Aggregatilinea lenta TaxID=913108 RepID=UPI000E5AAB19|nr:CheW domain-containing protein [Aggregatilinea lenta]
MQLETLFSEEELALLRLRAERVAAPLQEEDRAGTLTALVVVLQGEKYALRIDAITVVYQHVAIVPIPCVPEFVAGIANVRGHLISVLDLAALLGLRRGEDAAEAALVVAETEDARIGFRVETIGEVVELAVSQLNPVPIDMNLAQSTYLQGLFPDGTALLNMQVILGDPRLIVDDSAS